jgi:IclR family transcriptional regulator, KDG regulon repressor
MVINYVKPAPPKTAQATGSIAHAAEILICLSNDLHKVSDIARQCNFSKSTVHRVLKLLEQSNLVVEDTLNHRYHLGLLISQLAAKAIATHKRLISYAEAEMLRLSATTEETVTLDIMSGMQFLSLYEIPSQHNLRVTQESKRIGPLYADIYAGASAKVLLAQLDPARFKIVMDIMKIPPLTGRTVTDKKLLIAQLDEIRLKGYSVSRGERIPGAFCIAVPIKKYVLPVVLSVVGPDIRLQPRVKEVVTELKTSSERIGRNIEGIFGGRAK